MNVVKIIASLGASIFVAAIAMLIAALGHNPDVIGTGLITFGAIFAALIICKD